MSDLKKGIANLGKWTEKTAQAVRRICKSKNAPCVGFGLVFFEPEAKDDKKWNFVIELAFDPNNKLDKQTRIDLENAFSFISEGIKRIMSGVELENELDARDFSARKDLH